jgi:hypothetical protein
MDFESLLFGHSHVQVVRRPRCVLFDPASLLQVRAAGRRRCSWMTAVVVPFEYVLLPKLGRVKGSLRPSVQGGRVAIGGYVEVLVVEPLG